MSNPIIRKFKDTFQNITAGDTIFLGDLYTQDAIIVDPLKTIEGIDFFQDFFNQKIAALNHLEIRFFDEIINESANYTHAFLQWQLYIQDTTLQDGKAITVDGGSFLKIRDQVFFQQNYYDLGALFYENTPIIGYLVKKAKDNLSKF